MNCPKCGSQCYTASNGANICHSCGFGSSAYPKLEFMRFSETPEWGAEPGTPDGDRFEVLFTLVEAYEDQHYEILPPDPVEAIKYYMESRGLERKDLEPFIGTSGRVSEILNHKRPLTLNMIRKLNRGLGIPAEALINITNR